MFLRGTVPYDIDSMIGKVNEFEWEGGGLG